MQRTHLKSKTLKLPSPLSGEIESIGQGKWYYPQEKITFFELDSEKEVITFVRYYDELKTKERFGIITKKLSKELKVALTQKKISFLVLYSELCLFTKESTITQRYTKQKNISDKFSETTLISPNGFKILDIIIRMDRDLLVETNGRRLCSEFGLNASKLSQILKVCKVDDIVMLKDWLNQKDSQWWLNSFSNPRTRKGLTPFLTSKIFIPRDQFDKEDFYEKLKRHPYWNKKICFSGEEVMKDEGLLKDKNIYLCLEKDFEMSFLKEFLLIPAGKQSREASKIFVTIFKKSLDDEVIFSKFHNNKLEYNKLRIAWGLQKTDGRIQEARIDYLRRFLNENK